MGVTEVSSSSDQAVKHWASELAHETVIGLDFAKFTGRDENAIIQILPRLENEAGDQIKYDLMLQNRGPGVQGDAELSGYEEELSFSQATLDIDQLRNGFKYGKMGQQRTLHNLRRAAKLNLKGWYQWAMDGLMWAYLCGLTGTGAKNIGGIYTAGDGGAGGFAGNTYLTPDSGHSLALTSDTFDIRMLDYLKEKAVTAVPAVRPVEVDGGEKYVVALGPYQVTQLQAGGSTGTALSQWAEIHARVAEKGSKNPIYTGALGEYNGMVIHAVNNMPVTGSYSYGLLMGAQAGALAYGNAWDDEDTKAMGGPSMFSWIEEKLDYKNKKGVGVGCIFGIQKNQFDVDGTATDFGCIRLTTADTAHTALPS
jgi:N4-gp56 family major capsid protein